MSYFQTPRYGFIGYTINDLELDNGETFTGELSIEPEGYSSEDWYVYRACSEDPQDEDKLVYFDAETNTETFEAIRRAVYKNSRLCMSIGEEARI